MMMVGGILAAILVGPVRAAAPGDWTVKEASIRFVLDLTVGPSQTSAGYFVTLPDGGILPGPAIEPMVFDEEGNPLASGVLWHCPGTGCGLVFQAPKTGRSVTVYVRGAKRLKTWTPESGITPSVILCETHGATDQRAALQLGQFGPVGPMVQYNNQGRAAGNWQREKIPLAMKESRPGGAAMYLLAYVNVTDPGPIWVAPVSRSGQMDIAIDGKMLSMAKNNEKRGGFGAKVNLTSGLHKVELYGYNSAGNATGPMMFTWRTPKTSVAELGGARASDIRYPGTPMFESRLLRDEEVVKSGDCEMRDIQSRDGTPIACFTVAPQNVFWFEGEDAVIQYDLKAGTKSNPKGTRYSWSFDGAPGALASGSTLTWLFKGGVDCWVTLTAEAEEKQSTAHIRFCPYSGVKSSLNHPATREAFRTACLTMLKAYPANIDPLAKWDASMWNNFFRVLDLQLENVLVEYIVTQRWDVFKKKMDEKNRDKLEDLFLFSLGGRNPKEAMTWPLEFLKTALDVNRSVRLQLKRAEILMYYLDDLEGARKIITPLLATSGDAGEWARIRMGDLEILSRKLNEATQYYGDVQTRAKAGEADGPDANPRSRDATLSGPMNSADFARLKAPPREGARNPKGNKPAEMEPPPNVANWKLAAIRDVAASENVASMINQGCYQEAAQALRTWERSFPLTKITGDFILREAMLYMELKDYKRARAILSAYCDLVDASNFLPEALKMIKTCMIFMNEPEAEVEKYNKAILKRTQFGGGE
jgi:hypothetical protein